MASVLNYASAAFSPLDGTSSSYVRASIILAAALVTYVYYSWRAPKSEGIYRLPGLHFIHAWMFFSGRNDFLRSNFSRHRFFQFNVFQHVLIAVSGENARKAVFNHTGLSSGEGYKIMLGGGPSLEDVAPLKGEALSEAERAWFVKNIVRMLDKDRLQDVLPTLFADLNKRVSNWGTSGRINPFEDIYNLVLQMTCRMSTCRSFSEDNDAVDKLGKIFMTLMRTSTPVSLLLPWLPSPSRRANKRASTELYALVSPYVQERRNVNEPLSSDAIDVLIEEGLSDLQIIEWIFGALFAGLITTGIIACWVIVNADIYPEWKQKIREEISNLVDKHLGSSNVSGLPIHERLANIPIGVWEEEMPIMEACIRETIRLYIPGTILRRNMSPEFLIEDKAIGRGAFVAYDARDVHMDERLYPNPGEFNPGRFLERKPEIDSNTTFPYIGWGAGRHPCAGMKFAKLEVKITTALLFSTLEYKLVDRNGKVPRSHPEHDQNDIHQARPKKPCYIEFRRTVA